MKLLVAILFVAINTVSCRRPFQYTPSFYINPVDNETFVFFAEGSSRTESFSTAIDTCSEFGSLAQPKSPQEQAFIYSEISQGLSVWIGSRVEEVFDGASVSIKTVILDPEAATSSYRNWKEGEPTCYTSGCGIKMARGGYWGSFSHVPHAHVLCRIKRQYVDEILNSNHAETSMATMASTNTPPTTSAQIITPRETELDNKIVRLEREFDVLHRQLLSMTKLMRGFQEMTVKETKEYVNTSLTIMSVDFKSAINSLYILIENRTQNVE